MNALLRFALAVATVGIAAQAVAQVTFYEHYAFEGRSFDADRPIGNLERSGFNGPASSVVIGGGQWEMCEGPGFSGRCVLVPPGRYPSYGIIGLNGRISSARAVATEVRIEPERSVRVEPPVAPPAPAHITLFGRENFEGRAIKVDRTIGDLERLDFDQRASSVIVQGGAWEVCDETRFEGRCMVLQPGRYPSLAAAGMDNRISSLRRIEDARADGRPRRY
jgi:hypothetical protein